MPGRGTAIVDGNRLVAGDGAAALDVRISLDVPGQHNRANAAAAAACAIELGVDVRDVANALGELRMPAGRFETFEMRGGWRLIFDAYNASAGGTMAALDALDDQHAPRAIAVLASMAELGDESAQLHERVGAHAAKRADVVARYRRLCRRVGTRRESAALPKSCASTTNADAARWLRENARGGDAVLLKGSRKYRLEEILEELRS